jgi:transcriptional regulator with XRE-family HTH domain
MASELRLARLERGLSQAAVGRAVGLARSRVSTIERGAATGVDVVLWSELLATVGLKLSVEAYPLRQPIRDAGHRRLLDRLRAQLHPSLRWATEVPMPARGDLRAWDAMIRGDGWRIAVEAETRLLDVQALQRRIALKVRDSGIEAVLLVVADSRRNASVVGSYEHALTETFPIDRSRALDRLRAGAFPGGGAVVLL